MFDFSDPGSAQNRFCGTDLPRIGGIQNKHFYISEGSQLIIWLKTNSGLKVGTGFQLDWRGYDCPTDKPNINQGTCEATCPDFNDQGTCVDKCPPGRVINAAEKTCDTTCPGQGTTCMTNCPDTELLDQTTCVATCPDTRPNIDQMKVCMADCPTGRVINAAEKTCDTTCPDQGICVTNCPDTEPLLDQTTCVAMCPTERPDIDQMKVCMACLNFNDQGTCVDECPPGRVINAAEKTCDTTCPDQGDCVTTCPPNDLGPNDLLDTLLGTCVPTCPMDNPKNDQDTCVTDCPTTRPDDNNNMICGG